MAAAGPAATCHTRHARFAVLRVGTGEAAYVDLDGCLRILSPDGTLRQGTKPLVTLLDSA